MGVRRRRVLKLRTLGSVFAPRSLAPENWLAERTIRNTRLPAEEADAAQAAILSRIPRALAESPEVPAPFDGRGQPPR